MKTLVLFDIDGTLLSAKGISARAIREALVQHFGSEGGLDTYDYSGKTDPQIVRELMRGIGVDDPTIDRRMADTLATYHGRFCEHLRPEHVEGKPGVVDLVHALAARVDVTLGLLTGNLETCARLKVEPLGLNPQFPFGAFGSDHENRHELPAVAVERAHERTGHRFEGKNIVIVGDSVHDVLCGRSLGVRAVAVATGITSPERLAAHAPDALLPDFRDLERSLRAVLGFSPLVGEHRSALPSSID